MRRAYFLIASMLAVSVTPFACAEDFTGGGGLPGDVPRAETDATPADSARDRIDETASDTSVKDAVTDTDARD